MAKNRSDLLRTAITDDLQPQTMSQDGPGQTGTEYDRLLRGIPPRGNEGVDDAEGFLTGAACADRYECHIAAVIQMNEIGDQVSRYRLGGVADNAEKSQEQVVSGGLIQHLAVKANVLDPHRANDNLLAAFEPHAFLQTYRIGVDGDVRSSSVRRSDPDVRVRHFQIPVFQSQGLCLQHRDFGKFDRHVRQANEA